MAAADDRVCPDGGRCHHECTLLECFRVRACGPRSGVYPGDVWPTRVVMAFPVGQSRIIKPEEE